MMWKINSSCVLPILLFVMCIRFSNGTPLFLGGMMTFTVKDLHRGNISAYMEVLAGWRLGTGPCGPFCSAQDVHKQTHRQLAATSTANSSYFGMFTIDRRELSPKDRMTFNETVFSVNEKLGWEQDLMMFNLTLPTSSDREKVCSFSYSGHSWINLTLQGPNIPWNFHTTIFTNIRNDTKQRNRSPKSIVIPFYRIPFNRTTLINLPVVDDDGDIVQCEKSRSYLEIGSLYTQPAPGTLVHKNCSVEIAALSLHNYTGNDWIAIAVEVKDTNPNEMILGSVYYEPSRATFSKLQIQFTVRVETNLLTPIFVPPTLEPSHSFVVYVGSTWRTTVFAESHTGLVKSFIVIGTMKERLNTSPVQPDTKGRLNTVYSQISLATPVNEIKHDIVCVSAVDDRSVESSESRCFRLFVKDVHFNYSTQSHLNKPYFTHMPSPNDTLQCPLYDTCIFPIYVKSSREVANMEITQSGVDYTEVSTSISNMTFKAEHVFRADVSIRHYIAGKFDVCFKANDIFGVQSDESCVQLDVYTPDPCSFGPCIYGRCLLNDDRDTFICECNHGITGRYCETPINLCDPNPCENGFCYKIGNPYYCYCSDDGLNPNNYTGVNCSEKINDCPTNNTCSNNGICEDGFQNYTCNCFSGFSGRDCEIDLCIGGSSFICTGDGCPHEFCQTNGACSNGVCYCGMGYTGNHCETNITSNKNSELSIIEPTLTYGSMIGCTKRSDVIQQCMFDVYINSRSGVQNITLTNRSSTELSTNLHCTGFRQWSFYPGQAAYVNRCKIHGTIHKNDGHFVCVTVSEREWLGDTTCFDVKFIDEQHASSVRSLHPPTLSSFSRILMNVNVKRSFVLYTTYNNGICDVVKTASGYVHIMRPVPFTDLDGSSVCLTQMIVLFDQAGNYMICLRHIQEDLCFNFVVFGGNFTDPCLLHSDICQNDGVCFATESSKFKCICAPSYTGDRCERGPCRDDFCENNGHCFVNNNTKTCVCKPGYFGKTCSFSIVSHYQNVTWPVIERPSSLVKYVSCNRARLCEVYTFVVYGFNQIPHVDVGYTSKEIDVTGMDIIQIDSMPGVFKINVPFLPRQAGRYMLCLQTFANDRTNKDETCFNIDVIEGDDLIYGREDRPYFISPSLQPQSVVQCQIGEQCLVSYTAEPGKGHELQCLSGSLSSSQTSRPIEHYVYSSCEACVENKTAYSNCTLDVVFVPIMNQDTRMCFTLGLKGLQLEGERRCFSVTMPILGRMEGCRKLSCHNGGFCDGHDENHPVCNCRNGYSGPSCELKMNRCNTQFFESNNVFATEVKCSKNITCSYSFQVCSYLQPIVRISYASDNLHTHIISDTLTTSNNTGCSCYIQTVQITSSTPGSYRFCLQTKSRIGFIEDEICPTVRVSNTSNEVYVDKNQPHFVLPTFPNLSAVKCKRGGTCHLIVYHTEGYNSSQTCPRVKDTSVQPLEEQHIFASEMTAGVCMTDVAFPVPANTDLNNEYIAFCLKVSTASKQGEERCFSMQFVDNVLSQIEGPCKGMACYGNALCRANLMSNNGECICQDGYTGIDCNINIDECQSNPCANGGMCIDMINKYRCQCVNGYLGNQCHIDTNCDFENNSFCGWRNAHTGDIFDWTLCRGSTPSDGTGPNVDHTVGSSSGIYAFIETSAPRQANESAWIQSPLITPDSGMHCLSFWYNMFGPTIGQLNVYVSKNMVTPPGKIIWSQSGDHGSSWLHANLEMNTSDPFTITFEGKVGDGYEGDIALDDISLSAGPCVTVTTMPYYTRTVSHVTVPNTTPTTSPGGMLGTGCYGNPCARGVCYVHLDEYFCLCPSGFEGRNCQIDADECRSHPCKNGGTCEDDVDNFVCHCVHGYTGRLCDTDINECVSQPCQHGGKCVDELNHYTCTCLDGFDGEHCQNVLDPCFDNPCLRGTCFSHFSLFLCVCPDGYSGKFCEKDIDECLSNPCANGGTCSDQVNRFTCTCAVGYQGDMCQRNIDECASNPCHNNGICHDEAGSFRCECPQGYSEIDCSYGNGRKCFSCQGIDSNSMCNLVTTCKSDEVCFVESSSTVSGTHRFSFGCRRPSECIPADANNCRHCCDKDYCNDNGCGLSGYPPKHQRGPICLNCDDMTDMSFCKQVTACAQNQKCTTYGSPFTGYDGKCIAVATQCGFFDGNGFCQSCCSDDFCNYNCTKSYETTTMK